MGFEVERYLQKFLSPGMGLRRARVWGGMLLMLFGLSACQPIQPAASAEAAPDASSQAASSVAIVIDEQGITAPTTVPSGLVPVTFSNSGQAPHALAINWLAEGVTAEDAISAPPPGDPAKSDFVGFAFLAPGATVELMVNFTAGANYFVSDFFGEKPVYSAFSATGEATTAAAPNADVTVDLVNFSYIMPDQLKAGTAWWKLSNKGTQPHDLSIHQLSADFTLEDLQAQIEAVEADPTLPPPESPVPLSAVGVGQSMWIQYDLPAGEYVVLCQVPDLSVTPPGPSHWHKGMVHLFTVAP